MSFEKIFAALEALEQRLAHLEELDRDFRCRLARAEQVVAEKSEPRNREDDRRNFQTKWPN